VLVVESVVNVSTVATVEHDAGSAQQPERLGHLGLAGPDPFGDLVDAQLVGIGEYVQQVKPSRVAEQTEEGGPFLDSCRWH